MQVVEKFGICAVDSHSHGISVLKFDQKVESISMRAKCVVLCAHLDDPLLCMQFVYRVLLKRSEKGLLTRRKVFPRFGWPSKLFSPFCLAPFTPSRVLL